MWGGPEQARVSYRNFGLGQYGAGHSHPEINFTSKVNSNEFWSKMCLASAN